MKRTLFALTVAAVLAGLISCESTKEAAPVAEPVPVVKEDSAAKKAALAEEGAVDLGLFETASLDVKYDEEAYELSVKDTQCFQFPLVHPIQEGESITVHMTGVNNGTSGFRCWTVDNNQTTNSDLYLDCIGEALAPGAFDITFTLTATAESTYFFVKAPSWDALIDDIVVKSVAVIFN